MTAVSFSTQAKLLARYLRKKGWADLSHTEALEALAHTQNFKSFNEAQAAERHRAQENTQEKVEKNEALSLLAQARARGLTMADARGFFAKFRSVAELAFVAEARRYQNEGDWEIDDDAEVSMAPRELESGGAYVQMWRWIDVEEVEVPADLLDALELPWQKLRVCLDDEDDFESTFFDLEVNEKAIAALRAGEKLSGETWLIRNKAQDNGIPVITVKHYQALVFEKGQDNWSGQIDDNDWFIEMIPY